MGFSIKDYQCNGLKILRMKHIIIRTDILSSCRQENNDQELHHKFQPSFNSHITK